MRLLAYFWVLVTVVINVFALAGLLYHAGLADVAWGQPFYGLGQIYQGVSEQALSALNAFFRNTVGFGLPGWSFHALIAYLATASAVAVVTRRGETGTVSGIGNMVLSAAWITAIPVFLWRSITSGMVSQFARQNSGAVVGYVLAVLAVYGGARFVNATMLAPAAGGAPGPVMVEAELSCYTLVKAALSSNRDIPAAFDAAISAGDWDKAASTAAYMSRVAECRADELQPIDLARVNFDIANAFYEAGEEQDMPDHVSLAQEYFVDAFEAVKMIPVMTYYGSPAQTDEASILLPQAEQYANLARYLTITRTGRERGDLDYGDGRQAISLSMEMMPDGMYAAVSNDVRNSYDRILSEQKQLTIQQVDDFGTQIIAGNPEFDAQQEIDTLLTAVDRFFGYVNSDAEGINALSGAMVAQRLNDSLQSITPEEANLSPQEYAHLRYKALHLLIQKSQFSVAPEDRLPILDQAIEVYEQASRYGQVPDTTVDDEFSSGNLNPYTEKSSTLDALGNPGDAKAVLEKGIAALVMRNAGPGEATDLVGAWLGLNGEEVVNIAMEGYGYTAAPASGDGVRQKLAPLVDELCSGTAALETMLAEKLRIENICEEYVRAYVTMAYFIYSDKYDIAPAAAAYMDSGAEQEQVIISMLFGTTRMYDPDTDNPEKVFTSAEDPDSYGWRGEVTLSAPLSLLGPPLLADVFAKGAERKDYFSFMGLPALFGHGEDADAQFRQVLADRLASSDSEEVLIYVHGVGNSFADAAKRTAQLTYDLNFPGETMFYTWPTENNFLFYGRDADVPDDAVADFARFVNDAAGTAGKVNIIAHSHGAQVTVSGLRRAKDIARAAGNDLELGQIILAAPDVDSEELERAVSNHLVDIADRITIYTSPNDGALWLSSILRMFDFRGGLGRGGDQCAADMIDASGVVPFGAHGYFAKESEVIADIRTLFWHQDLRPEDRCFLQPQDKSGAPWKFSKDSCDVTAFDIALTIAAREKRSSEPVDFDSVFASLDRNRDYYSYEEARNYGYLEDDVVGEGWVIVDYNSAGRTTTLLENDDRYIAAEAAYTTIMAAGSTSSQRCNRTQ